MIGRRAVLAGLAVGAFAPAAPAHTLYPQWVAYRRKHLLIGCHRKDPETFRLAEMLVEGINHALPKAKARAARAPHPERLASLIGTDQMEVAVLSLAEAQTMRDGTGKFAPYGPIALTALAGLGAHVLIADVGFPDRHAWMVRAAVLEEGLAQADNFAGLRLHPGAARHQQGVALQDLTSD